MRNSEIKGLSDQELKEKISAEEENFHKLKFANEISPIENPMKIRQTRRLIARLKTEKTKREKNIYGSSN